LPVTPTRRSASICTCVITPLHFVCLSMAGLTLAPNVAWYRASRHRGNACVTKKKTIFNYHWYTEPLTPLQCRQKSADICQMRRKSFVGRSFAADPAGRAYIAPHRSLTGVEGACEFFDDLADLLERVSMYTNLLVIGDINLHLNVRSDPHTIKF